MLKPLRPGLAAASQRPPLGRSGNRAGLGPRRRGGRATAHLPRELGPHAARLAVAYCGRQQPGKQSRDPKPCTTTGRRRGYLLSFNTSTRSAQFSHIVRPPPPPPPLRIALTDPDRRGGGERGGGAGRPAGLGGNEGGRRRDGAGSRRMGEGAGGPRSGRGRGGGQGEVRRPEGRGGAGGGEGGE